MTTATAQDWYAESLQQIEQATSPRADFPLSVWVGERCYQFSIWAGEQLPDRLLAYDCETRVIQAGEIPELALASICGDQGSCYFIHPQRLPQFIRQHSQAFYAAHNATFDFWVTAQALQADRDACKAWWAIAGDARLFDTMLADMLIRLAQSDAEPVKRDLAAVAAEYAPRIQLDKSDPYRLRYGELIGLSTADWPQTERGFWTYAAGDPVATLAVCQAQAHIARALIEPYASELLPDSLRRFGPLTACLQTQGAIALDYISRLGVSIDLSQAGQLQAAISELTAQHMQTLEQQGGELFRRYGPRSKQAGQLMTSGAGVAKRNAKAIKARLEQIARESDAAIRPPRNADGLVTDSVKYWAQHRDAHPLIAAYCDFSEQAKLLQFFAKLDRERIYPRYRPLVRTGRSSCSGPNLQQLPRSDQFRSLFVAPPGFHLLQIDYSVLELRTLAQICLRRYGRSVLADLFRAGIDPHKYTAALLLDLDLPRFEQLPAAEMKRCRQQAKALNFGIPGGLGAASLVAYAKSSYGVQLTIEQARQFRDRLTQQIYPELAAYLQDNQQADIARNLQSSPQLVSQAFSRRDQIQAAMRIISGEDSTPAGDEYSPELIAHVWLCLSQLNRNPDLQAAITARQADPELARRIFLGDAVTLSGRLRGHIGYTQRANTPFQGLAADGNKLALFRLLRAGYRVCGFVHDEMLVLLPDGSDYQQQVDQIQAILRDSMQELTPDIPIATEYLLADRWYKDAPPQPRDAAGRIIPYRRPADPAQADWEQHYHATRPPQAAQLAIEQPAQRRQPAGVISDQTLLSFVGDPEPAPETPTEPPQPPRKRRTSKASKQPSQQPGCGA